MEFSVGLINKATGKVVGIKDIEAPTDYQAGKIYLDALLIGTKFEKTSREMFRPLLRIKSKIDHRVKPLPEDTAFNDFLKGLD